jgi:hypothetical protein
MRELGHDHHENQIEEELEEADPAFAWPIFESGWGLPKPEPRRRGHGDSS